MMRALIGTTLALALSSICYGHSGGTDSSGGHMDHSKGTYHMHHSGSNSSMGMGLFGVYDDGSAARAAMNEHRKASAKLRGVRMAARKEARSAARKPPAYTAQPAKFEFHHTKLSPYLVASFEDGGKDWKSLLAKGFNVNLQKDVIVRIEPIEDATDYRTWYDVSGEHSVVARYDTYIAPTVKLIDMAENEVPINANSLSEYDQKHIYYKILHPEKAPRAPGAR